MLTTLGATPAEDEVYRYLTTVGSATAGEVATELAMPAPVVAASIAGLVARGLVGELDDRYAAAPPEIVETLLRNRLRELWAAQDALAKVAEDYRLRQATANGYVEVVTGRQALGRRIQQILQTWRDEHLMLIRPPIVALEPADGATPPRSYRGVYDAGLLADPSWLEGIRRTWRPGEQVRTHPAIPVKLIIADRAIGILPISRGSDSTSAAVLVYPSGLLDALVALFEQVWAVSLPLVVADDAPEIARSPLDPAERALLSLLVAGLTDEAIAAHQGVSPRTVQRRVQALMTATRSRTRMQLAWQAARNGWL